MYFIKDIEYELCMLMIKLHVKSTNLQVGQPTFKVSILYKSTAGRYRSIRVADEPITAHYGFIKTASWVQSKKRK